MTSHKVWIDDYSHFIVTLTDDGEPDLVMECRIVWTPKDHTLISERINRAIAQAIKQNKAGGWAP